MRIFSCGDISGCAYVDPQWRVTPPEESDYTHYAFSIAGGGFRAFAGRLNAAGVPVWKTNKSEGAVALF